MKRYLLLAMTAITLTATGVYAQEDKKPSRDKDKQEKNKLEEYDEIIIKRKDADKDVKVTVEIKDDQVLVDGKPLQEFVDEEVSVKKRSTNRYKLEDPSSPFRNQDGNWFREGFDMRGPDKAFLGVMTEGTTEGARIERVTENSAAAKAGLKPGDVITKVNDKKVFDHEQLSEAIDDFKPEEKVTITYKRAGKENKTTATLGKRTGAVTMRTAPRAPLPPMTFNFDDHEFGQIFDNMRGRPRLGIKAQDTEEGKGVKVLEVDEGSAAEKAGIKENDIITGFEGKDVNSVQELAEASREAKDKTSLKVQLKRNGKPQTIEVKIPKKLKTANL